MRKNLIFPIILLAAALSFASMFEADLTSSDLAGFNCNPTGGPAIYTTTAWISNDFSEAIVVTYSYYDFQAQAMVDGGRICAVGPKSSDDCRLNIPVSLSGTGNGTSSLMVILKATPLSGGNTESKIFSVHVNHISVSAEGNVAKILDSTDASILAAEARFESPCEVGVCCGMNSAKDALVPAKGYVLLARSELAACRFTNAIVYAENASTAVRAAGGVYDKFIPGCAAILQTVKNAHSNISYANATVLARAVCRVNISDAREKIAISADHYNQAVANIFADNYANAETLLMLAVSESDVAVASLGNCSSALSNVPVVNQTITTPTQSGPSISIDFSGILGALGYLVIGAIIIVVAAALYVSFSGRTRYVPPQTPKAPQQPPVVGKKEEPEQSLLDKEFEEWLKRTEGAEYAEVEEPAKEEKPKRAEPKRSVQKKIEPKKMTAKVQPKKVAKPSKPAWKMPAKSLVKKLAPKITKKKR